MSETKTREMTRSQAILHDAARLTPSGYHKLSPERMATLLDKMMEFPAVTKACLMAGIVYSTLRYWLVASERGQRGDGYDLEYAGEAKRFHEHFYDVRDAAMQLVEDAYVERAIQGYYEVLSDKGRVQYQYDETLLALGLTGPEAYLRGADGKPIPERISHQDPDVMLTVLKAWRRDRWGAHQQVDVLHKGGVLVVGVRAKDSAEIEAREKERLADPVDVEFREVEDE